MGPVRCVSPRRRFLAVGKNRRVYNRTPPHLFFLPRTDCPRSLGAPIQAPGRLPPAPCEGGWHWHLPGRSGRPGIVGIRTPNRPGIPLPAAWISAFPPRVLASASASVSTSTSLQLHFNLTSAELQGPVSSSSGAGFFVARVAFLCIRVLFLCSPSRPEQISSSGAYCFVGSLVFWENSLTPVAPSAGARCGPSRGRQVRGLPLSASSRTGLLRQVSGTGQAALVASAYRLGGNYDVSRIEHG